MTKTIEKPKYSKLAFVDAAKDGKERLILQVILDDAKSYSEDEVTKALKEWKSREVKA